MSAIQQVASSQAVASPSSQGIGDAIASVIGLSTAQKSEGGSGQTQTIQPASITVAGSTIVANSASQFVVGTQTLSAGGSAIVLSGTTLSVATSGTALVVNGQTTAIAAPSDNGGSSSGAITAGGQTLSFTASDGAVVVGSQTLTPGAVAAVSGQRLSVASNGVVVANGSPVATVAGIAHGGSNSGTITAGGQTLSYAASNGAIFVGSQTLTPGSVATIAGQQVSLGSNGVLDVNGSPVATAPAAGTTPAPAVGSSSGVLIAGGQTLSYSQLSNGGLVIGSTTLSPGSAATIDGQVVSVNPEGVVDVNGSPAATGPTGGSPSGVLTVGGQTVSYTELSQGNLVVGSSTLTPGSLVTINGQVVSLAPDGVVDINGSPVITLPVPINAGAVPSAGLLTLGSQTVSYHFSGSALVVGMQTLLPGHTIIVDGDTLTLGPQPSEIEIISGSRTISTIGRSASATITAASGVQGSNGASPSPTNTQHGSAASVQVSALAVCVLGLGVLLFLILT